jgi:hypothetical protein
MPGAQVKDTMHHLGRIQLAILGHELALKALEVRPQLRRLSLRTQHERHRHIRQHHRPFELATARTISTGRKRTTRSTMPFPPTPKDAPTWTLLPTRIIAALHRPNRTSTSKAPLDIWQYGMPGGKAKDTMPHLGLLRLAILGDELPILGDELPLKALEVRPQLRRLGLPSQHKRHTRQHHQPTKLLRSNTISA